MDTELVTGTTVVVERRPRVRLRIDADISGLTSNKDTARRMASDALKVIYPYVHEAAWVVDVEYDRQAEQWFAEASLRPKTDAVNMIAGGYE